jgi:hypothetical protein
MEIIFLAAIGAVFVFLMRRRDMRRDSLRHQKLHQHSLNQHQERVDSFDAFFADLRADFRRQADEARKDREVEVGEPKCASERPADSDKPYETIEVEEGPDPSEAATVSAQPEPPAPASTGPSVSADGTFSLSQLDTILVPTVIRLHPDFVARCDEEAVLLAERAKQAAEQKRQQRAARRQAKARLKADPKADLSEEELLELANLSLTHDPTAQAAGSLFNASTGALNRDPALPAFYPPVLDPRSRAGDQPLPEPRSAAAGVPDQDDKQRSPPA